MTQALRINVDAGRVRSAFASLRRRLADMRGAWQQVGAELHDAAVPFVPIESGRLVDSLTVDAHPAGVELESTLIYAGVQDRGWPAHNIAGHHFMDKAEDAAPAAAVDELSSEIQRLIDAVGLG